MDAHRPCPDSALLAAFLDGTLAEYERTAVVTHLTECAQCRAVALTVVEFREVQSLDEIWQVESQVDEPPRRVTRVAQWTRQKTRAPAILVGAVVVVVAVALYTLTGPRPEPQSVASLVVATAGQRLTEARLSDGFGFAPRRVTTEISPASGARLISAASTIRKNLSNEYAAPARRAVGVAALLVADLDEAVASLSIASLAAPNDAKIANDLAAAYYERAHRLKRAEDFLAALDAAERAAQLQPEMPEALFNRALALEALGLREEARDAWRAYQRRDSVSAWATEARQREGALSQSAVAPWADILRRLNQAVTPDLAESAVTLYPAKTREFFEQTLEEWSAAARGGADAPVLQARLQALGRAFHAVQNERFYQDVAGSIDEAVAERRQEALAAAHAVWFDARRFVSSGDATRAHSALRRAIPLLGAQRSPIALWAQVEQSTTSYHLKKFDEGLRSLPWLRREATSRGYRVVATRAAWMTGLLEYSRNDLPSARVAYEEMLALASLPGDVDQFVMANVLLANVHDLTGESEVAWDYRLAAMPLVEQCEMPSVRFNAMASAAGGATAGNYAGAALLFGSRLIGPEARHNPPEETLARIQRAEMLRRLGRADAAASELRLARSLFTAIADPSQLARREADALVVESRLSQERDPSGALRLAEQATQWAARTGEAFVQSQAHLQYAEAALANGKLEDADDAVTRAIAELDLVRGASIGDSRVTSEHELPLYSTAVQIAMRRGDLARAFDYTERRRLRRLYESRAEVAPALSLKEIQRELDASTAVAVFTQAPQQLHIWLITRDDVVMQSAALTPSRAASLVSAHWQEISKQAAAPTIGAELFETLLRPIQRQLSRAETLVVVADAPYNLIALPALFDRVRDRFLVEDFQIVSAPTVTSFAMNLGRSTRDPGSAGRIAVLNASNGSIAPAAGTQALASDLAALYGGAGMQAGDSATPSEVLRQIADQDVVHISATVTGSRTGMPGARLRVADEPGQKYSGTVSAIQLASASAVRARLVTLDAAAVHRGELPSSSGSQQLAMALIAAGVPTVVGQVSILPSTSLNRTWVEFHRHYAAGVAAAESLRRAQIAALTASKRRVGPWAALTVFGSNL